MTDPQKEYRILIVNDVLENIQVLGAMVGLEFAPFISFQLDEIHDGKVLVIEGIPSTKPVFLKTNEGDDFFIRVGPSSRKFSSREVLEYVHTGKTIR